MMSKTIKKIRILLAFLFVLAVVPGLAGAQQAPPLDVVGIFNRIADLLWGAAVGIIIIVFIWAGIKYLLTKGEPHEISEANHMIIWALVGTAVILLAWSLQSFVQYILGLP